MSTEKIAQSGISPVMEGRRIVAHVTVEENLRVGARAKIKKGSMRNDLDVIYGYFPRLRTMCNAIVRYCSGGEQQIISIGRSLVSNPRIILTA